MSRIQEISARYAGSLTDDQKDELRTILPSIRPDELSDIRDHKTYIELLAKYRKSIMRNLAFVGTNFIKTLESMLSVGEDGLYSNRFRFLYELIQNVDDCEYENISDCKLDIQFCYSHEPGQIILSYNEKGFKPKDVFAITGIAEASKNISTDKVEIGEKGIGFKSVFGIADKVIIQSGKFSFSLSKSDFIVPVPFYEGFQPVNGTRLTLEMSCKACHGIYRSLADQYIKKDAILNKNPILFLNKLTRLRMYYDSFRYMEFNVERKASQERDGLSVEENVDISVRLKDHKDGGDTGITSSVSCYRYTMPIVYDAQKCKSRYGDDSSIIKRNHNLIAVFPILTEDLQKYHGMLYSFLPTQVQTTVPLLLHVPYKLDGARESVDSQNNNAWFNYTNEKLSWFLKHVYIDLAHILKQDIIRYIPTGRDQYFFSGNLTKMSCLRIAALSGKQICDEKVFWTESGCFENAHNIVSFRKDENIDDPVYVHKLLNYPWSLFVPTYPVDMQQYGVRTIENVIPTLFDIGMKSGQQLDEILTWIEKNVKKPDYDEFLKDCGLITLSGVMLGAIVNHKQLESAMLSRAKQFIRHSSRLGIKIGTDVTRCNIGIAKEIRDAIDASDLHPNFKAYLGSINYSFYVIKTDHDFGLMADNGIVLCKGRELGSFGRLSGDFDTGETFSASFQLRQASTNLNNTDDSVSNEEYLAKLRSVRRSVRDVLGPRKYGNYIQIISNAGSDPKRFINELMQNADDCAYPEDVTPCFRLQIGDGKLTTSYNERGFTKANVRAITAIGESTKKQLIAGTAAIGEKGVGFKSVFAVADSVEIHSNGFDFTLEAQAPTIPAKCRPLKDAKDGTTMIFSIKDDEGVKGALSAEKLLQLCICLRRLKELHIYHHDVKIVDDGNTRTIFFDGQRYVFERIEYEFTIQDEQALAERSSGGKKFDKAQKIICYIPEQLPKQSRDMDMLLYSGLPTDIKSNVPLIIDAPFELTTSREDILENRWNDIVRDQVYKAILHLMESKRDTGLDVLKYVGFSSKNGKISWENFSGRSGYLNQHNFCLDLKSVPILPLLGSNHPVAVYNWPCLIVPDFIAGLQKYEDVQACFSEYVIDTQGKSQYIPLLEALGCKRADAYRIYTFLQDRTARYINDNDFRKGLYNYMSGNQGNISFGVTDVCVKTLPVFPVRFKGGTQYMRYNESIYYTDGDQVSYDDYYILDRGIMPIELADKILGRYGRIKELTQEVIDAKYRANLEAYIRNEPHRHTATEITDFLVQELRDNRAAITRCQYVLRGMRDQIPLLMANGIHKAGKKYLNSSGQAYRGNLVRALTVDRSCEDLGMLLGLDEVQKIHYDGIDLRVLYVSDCDIEDLQSGFENCNEIISKFAEQGLISDEQIEKYDLWYLQFVRGGMFDQSNDDPYEKFPEKGVVNIGNLRRQIQRDWNAGGNRYVERSYIRWQPESKIDVGTYLQDMYGSSNRNKSFCQMCHKRVANGYIENNNIDKRPVYAWKQMSLNLCLECSKRYLAYRNQDEVWKQFIRAIMSADTMRGGIVQIPIGQEKKEVIYFTATHLAEVQEIFRLQGWGDSAPKRKPEVGHSEDDEEE